MKVLILIGVIALVGVLVAPAAGAVQPRTLHRQAPAAHAPSVQEADITFLDCGKETLSCLNCFTRLSCTKIGNVLRPVTATACPAATPYCSAGACSAVMPYTDTCTGAPEPVEDFTCNGDGYFPDPASCRNYHLCVDGKAYTYNCSLYPNTVYSHAKAMCVHQSEATCSTAACSYSTIGKYQVYRQDDSVYFVCTDTVAANAYVGACPKNHKVDVNGNCVLSCLQECRLPHEEDTTKYYECIKTGTNTFAGPNLATCPPGSTFDVVSERCVPLNSNDSSDASDFDEDMYAPSTSVSEDMYKMPSYFKVGTSTAAYQIEGAWNEDGKSASVQDVYFHARPTMLPADVACDSYHKWEDDIAIMKALKMQSYRFSLSWSRLLPTGGPDNPNQAGIDYYNKLIDGLLDAGIEPLVTLHHWDLPQIYEEDGGFLNESIQDRFANYSDFAFRTFGDRVKSWITLNEPKNFCESGHETGESAPGVALSGTGAYMCMHNSILAHAKAYRIYESTYKATQQGKVGCTCNLNYAQPWTKSPADAEAANRLMEFTFAWIADPLSFGEYPASMRDAVDTNSKAGGLTTSRLPSFTAEEKEIITGSWDFIGLNHYDSKPASTGTVLPMMAAAMPSYSNDLNVTTYRGRKHWIETSYGWRTINPWGLRAVLNWIKKRYNNMPIIITENGYTGVRDEGTNDPGRVGYHSGYMRAALRALNEDGVNLQGYNIWTLMDNVEWTSGLTIKYGLAYVDFDSPNRTRTLKESAPFFQDVMTNRYVHYVKVVPPTKSPWTIGGDSDMDIVLP